MRSSDILLVLGALACGPLACTAKTPTEATEVPAAPRSADTERSCRHELGRCGGHEPGDGACRTAAPTEPAKHDPPPPTPLERVRLGPGEFAEINLEMGAGASTDVAFQAEGGPLEWNVHSHDGDKVEIHAEGVGATGDVRFTAPGAGPFSYMWKNAGGAPVQLTVRLSADGPVRVHSIHPAP